MRQNKRNNLSFIDIRAIDTEVVFGSKIVSDIKKLQKIISHCRALGLKIVLTQGTWDLLHIGHARYFREAKKHGNLLVVGVDSDEKVRARKGPDRPVVPQSERMEMVAHVKYADLVVLKNLSDPKWFLIKSIRPDVLIATRDTYTSAEIKALKKFCGEVKVLKPQATTTTSAKIRLLQISAAKKIEKALRPRLLKTIEDVLAEVRKKK